MTLQVLPYDYTICKIKELSQFDLSREIFFVGKTDEELSLVCRTEDVPADTVEREDPVLPEFEGAGPCTGPSGPGSAQ